MKRNYYEESKSDFIDYEKMCPECQSNNLTKKKYYEFADADNNRGVWITYVRCLNCGWEVGY